MPPIKIPPSSAAPAAMLETDYQDGLGRTFAKPGHMAATLSNAVSPHCLLFFPPLCLLSFSPSLLHLVCTQGFVNKGYFELAV